MVDDNKVAWHAGKSKWEKLSNLNSRSIGIELENKGHQFGYQRFSKKQIKSLLYLTKILKKKYNINSYNAAITAQDISHYFETIKFFLTLF